MIDKLHSATTFIKYESEKHVDMNNPSISPLLRNHPYVDQKIKEGKDIADTFFEFHLKSIEFTDEELKKYNIDRITADKIVEIIKSFGAEIYSRKINGPWSEVKKDFPPEAMIYNRNL